MRAIRHRVESAQRAIPRRDYAACIAWAREHGIDTDDAMVDFDHRASVLEWVDGLERDAAEAKALEQMKEMHR